MILRYDQGMTTHHEPIDHPLTETAAAELWDTHAGDTVPWEDWYGGSRRALTSMLRAAFDAGRAHERSQELPTEPGAVIVPADGHEYIEATMRGETVRAREATRSGAGGWYAAWRSGEQTSGLASSREITPGTWKVDDR